MLAGLVMYSLAIIHLVGKNVKNAGIDMVRKSANADVIILIIESMRTPLPQPRLAR